MNNDYLWDRTGRDDEIEGLENALAQFRYIYNVTPALPSKTALPEIAPRRAWFGFRLAIAFASVALLLVAAIFMIPKRHGVNVDESAIAAAPQQPSDRKVEAPPSPENNSIEPKVITQNEIKRIDYTPEKLRKTAHISRPKELNHPVELTKEEKFAYGQLMLALSITESKLKIVRDTIAGENETKAVSPKSRDLIQK